MPWPSITNESDAALNVTFQKAALLLSHCPQWGVETGEALEADRFGFIHRSPIDASQIQVPAAIFGRLPGMHHILGQDRNGNSVFEGELYLDLILPIDPDYLDANGVIDDPVNALADFNNRWEKLINGEMMRLRQTPIADNLAKPSDSEATGKYWFTLQTYGIAYTSEKAAGEPAIVLARDFKCVDAEGAEVPSFAVGIVFEYWS